MGQKETGRGWQSDALDTVLHHLKTCPYQPEHIRTAAANWKANKKTSSPSRRTYQEAFGGSDAHMQLPGMGHFTIAGSSSTIPIVQPAPSICTFPNPYRLSFSSISIPLTFVITTSI